MTFYAGTLRGIYVVLGDVQMRNGVVLYGTIVVTETVRFNGHIEIYAQPIPDTDMYYPAIVALDSSHEEEGSIEGFHNLIVEGAIYSSDYITLRGGLVTGPLIGQNVELKGWSVIDDNGSDKYYNTIFPGEEGENLDKYIDRGSWAYDN